MHAKLLRQTKLTGTLLLLATALLGLIGLARAEYLAVPTAAPEAAAPQASATLPADTCTWDGPVRTCELWATTGTVDLPGMPGVPIWGYSDTVGGPAQLPGPLLIVNQGETVDVVLHNDLGENTSLSFEGQDGLPDLVGVTPGASKTYTVDTTNAGTFLYEAGPLSNAQHQVALGLYGALIVRPVGAPLQAYASADTAFDDEALLVLSEVDPALNNSLDPATFDMRNYKPRYWLINGKAYPDTDPILTEAGRKVLLRYVNAGQQPHTMAILGTDQEVLSLAGAQLPHYRQVASEILGPGQSADAIATIPATPPAGTERFVLYDASLLLHNNGAAGFGGMLTFLTITPQAPGPDTVGPTASALTLSPNPTNGTVDVLLTASISDAASGGSVVTAAEYFIGAAGAAGTGSPLTATDLAFDSPVESVQATITIADLALLSSGQRTIYVHGQDANGNWGVFNSVVLRLDKTGPATSSIGLIPAVSDGSVSVAIQATASDAATGNSDVVAAEYTIDGGSASPMTLNQVAPVVSLTATIPAATMQTLSEGGHTLAIRSQDALGNWGADATATLAVDKSGPVASNVSAYPNPNNGTLGVNPITPSVRVDVTLDDLLVAGVNSSIKRAEGFIDTVGAPGSGFPFTPGDGVYNSAHELAYAFIPLSTVNALSEGPHTIYVRGRDAAGNWGTTATTTLFVDKTRPTVSGVGATPNPTGGAASVTLTGTATDAASSIVAAEWFTGGDPGPGNATAMAVSGAGPWTLTATIDVSTWTNGTYTLSVRARDAAGNWSLTSGTSLVVDAPFPGLSFSTAGNTAVPTVGGAPDDADIYNWSGTTFSRLVDATGIGMPAGANVDGLVVVSPTDFYISLSGNWNIPGPATAQDEDVIHYNAGTWSVYFDGTALGLTAAAQDLDAIDIVGGILYFSTTGNGTVPGVAGPYDDADIYAWNGAAFSRVFDASVAGLPAGANVDGLEWVSANNFYLSFSAANTTVPGLGAVQDEDVVKYSNGTWSLYFDGTALGLTAEGQDLDAIDIP